MSWFKRDSKESTSVPMGVPTTLDEFMVAMGETLPECTEEEYQAYLRRKEASDNQWQRIEAYGYKNGKKGAK